MITYSENSVLSRNKTVDCMKGVLITLVVLGHTYNPLFHDFIYLFHVGLFFVLSGYCFNQGYTDSFASLWNLFKRRVKSLWIPYVAYNFIFLLLQNVWLRIGFLTSDESYFSYNPFLSDGFCLPLTVTGALKALLKSFFFMNSRPFAGGLWFLGGLFYVTFLYAAIQFVVRKVKIEKLHIIISAIFLLAAWLVVKLGLTEKIPVLKQGAIILISEILFCAGTYIREYVHVPEMKNGIYYVIFLCCFILLCILASFETISIGSAHIVNPVFFIASIILGGGVLLYFVKILSLLKIDILLSFFSFVGKRTIPVLALHPICFKVITFIQWKLYGGDKIILAMYPVWKNTVLWSMGYLIAGLFIPLLIAIPLSRTKMGKIVFKC